MLLCFSPMLLQWNTRSISLVYRKLILQGMRCVLYNGKNLSEHKMHSKLGNDSTSLQSATNRQNSNFSDLLDTTFKCSVHIMIMINISYKDHHEMHSHQILNQLGLEFTKWQIWQIKYVRVCWSITYIPSSQLLLIDPI